MDDNQRKLCAFIRALSSAEAATWIIDQYPLHSVDFGEAFILMPHRSWRREDQIKLANHYLKGIPFASERVYEAFLSFMSVPVFTRIVKNNLPDNKSDLSLLTYYLKPLLTKLVMDGNSEQEVRELFQAIKNKTRMC